MKKHLIFLTLLVGSFCATAQDFRAYDNCASVKLYDTLLRKYYTFPKSQLSVYKTGSTLQLLKQIAPVVVATWDNTNISLLAADLDAGEVLLSSWLNTTCVTVYDGAQCLELNGDTLSVTGCEGEIILPNANRLPFDTFSGAWGDISYTKLYNPINAPDTTDKRHIGMFYYRGGETPFGLVHGFAMDVENGMSVVGIGNDSINDFEFEAVTGKFKITGIPPSPLAYIYGEDENGLLTKSLPPLDLLRDTTIVIDDTLAIQNCFTAPITVLDIPFMNVLRVSVKVEYSEPDTVAYNFSDPCNLSQAGDTLDNLNLNAFCCDSVMYGTASLQGNIQAWSASRPLTLWNEKSNATRGRGIIRLKIYYTLENF